MSRLLRTIGDRLAAYLLAPRPHVAMVATVPPDRLEDTLRPGDVLLVEGESRISMAIKVLTQSNWSHAALFVGSGWPGGAAEREPLTLIEADLRAGWRACRPAQCLRPQSHADLPSGRAAAHEIEQLVGYVVGGLGQHYDLKNLLDLARYLLPAPPVPCRWRRRLIDFGRGDPSRAICSTLIAEAFQSVHHPILPEVTFQDSVDGAGGHCLRELMHIRHHSLYAPRDFDMSPYFDVVKPTLLPRFDPHGLAWEDAVGPTPERH